MQRLVLVLVLIAAIAAIVTIAARAIRRISEDPGGTSAAQAGGAMQKLSFFLLLCLILYVSLSGAS